jgi:hypothetical protein
MASPALVRGDHSRSFPILLLLLLAIAGELCLAASALLHCIAGQSRTNFFATAGVLLSLAAIVQFRAACSVFQHRASARLLPARKFLRALFVSAGLSYGIGLAVGPVAGIGLLWAGCFALFASITLLPLAANPQTVERWRKLVEQAAPRRVGLAVYHTLLALTIAEALLRGYRALDAAAPLTMATASEPIASDQAAAAEAIARPGVLRVGIVDGLAGSTSGETFRAEQLISSAAGLKTFPLDWTARAAQGSQWRNQLETQRPDLVLAVISLENGLKPINSPDDAFDWRSLETVKLLHGLFAKPADQAETNSGQPETEGHRLSICRTPLDDAAKTQWRSTFADLDVLLADCAEAHVRVALVVVPDGFQVNRVLCDTLRRRAGYEPQQLDLGLPQRRLATYAQERRLALVDLLPYLQASRDPVYQHATGGWNAEGKAVASRAICGWLQSQYSGLTATVQLSSGN